MAVEWKDTDHGGVSVHLSTPPTRPIVLYLKDAPGTDYTLSVPAGTVMIDGERFAGTLDAAKAEAVRRAVEKARGEIERAQAFLKEVGEE